MRFLSFAACAAAAAVILCGCGGGGNSSEVKKNTADGTAYLEMRPADSLDPLKTDKKSVRDVLSACYEPLFTIDKNISPKGVIAKSWSMDDDAKTVTVSIKEGILWHDGKKLTAADVVYTVDKLKNLPDSPYRFAVKYVASAEAEDNYTVKFKLTRPYAQFVYSLYFPIEPSHAEELDETVVGCGAYKLKEYTKDDRLVLDKFDSWHGGDAACKIIDVSIVRDRESASSSFLSGMLTAISGDSFDLSNNALKDDMRATAYPSSRYEYIAFNHERSIFSSSGVRSAVSNAIDRSEIVSECYGSYADAANIPLHPSGKDIAPSPTLSAYDLDNAMEMLFYEGYGTNETNILLNEKGEPFGFTLLVNEENTARCRAADIIASQLLKAGMTVRVTRTDYETYKSLIERREYDAYLGGTAAGNIYDFEYLLSADGELNNYGYRSNYMELALSNMANSPSRGSFEEAALNFGEVFVREEPVCGLLFVRDAVVSARTLKNAPSPALFFPFANIADWEILSKN